MQPDLADAIATAAREMSRPPTLVDTMEAVVAVTAQSLPGFGHVGVSLSRRGRRTETPACSGPLVRALDSLQYELDEGPCLDAVRGAELVTAPTIRHDQRWPRYVGPAVERGLRSQMAVRMYVDDDGTVGGLNLYSTEREEIPDEDVHVARLLARHAAIALGHARHQDALATAVESGRAIGKAIGIVMERYQLGEQAATAFLWRVSSHSNRKVRDVALDLVTEAEQSASASDSPPV